MQQEEIKDNYNLMIEQKRRGFEVTLKIVSSAIQRMKEEAIISDDVAISARLKSFKSAYENSIKGKKVDDCFGIRIVARNEQELEKIEETIQEILNIVKSKNHKTNHSTGYNALHQMAILKENFALANNMEHEQFPIVELQYWTKEIEKDCVHGELAYSRYKKKDMEKIRKTYKESPSDLYPLLPVFYEVKGDKIRTLSSEETLRKMYPDLELNIKKAPEEERLVCH